MALLREMGLNIDGSRREPAQPKKRGAGMGEEPAQAEAEEPAEDVGGEADYGEGYGAEEGYGEQGYGGEEGEYAGYGEGEYGVGEVEWEKV